jgi:N-acetylmuramoyl-L-alanine amidase
MWLKSILSNSSFAIVFLLFVGKVAGQTVDLSPDSITDPNAQIKVVYPKEGSTLGSVDSAFILGNVPPEDDHYGYKLFIDSQYIPVHRDGGFIAFLPIKPGPFEFHLTAFLVKKKDYKFLSSKSHIQDVNLADVRNELELTRTVTVPTPIATPACDSLAIVREYRPPGDPLFLKTGDRLAVSFLGTPGCHAWFQIPGVADSIPMAENPPALQPYWDEAVFGAGAVPDSVKIAGIYSGFYDIPPDAHCDSVVVKYFLAPPTSEEVLFRMFTGSPSDSLSHVVELLALPPSFRATTFGSFKLSINSPAFPMTVQFTDSVQILRYAPRKGYFAIFQPEGAEALATGAEGDWYRLRLASNQTAWAAKSSVIPLAKGILPPTSFISSIRSYSQADKLLVEFPLAGKHPFRVIEDDERNVRIQLFGVTTDTDWIRYDFSDPLIDLATWSEPEQGMYELKLRLNQDIWGYDAYYIGNTFYFQLNKPPEDVGSLKHKVIVVDPGHSKDPGSIGPTGYCEKDANLAIALAVAKKLRSKGATVIMTRSDTSDVPLYDRPKIAVANDADLFVSIHNNALPDGINPFENNGTSTYYYHPHSIALAKCIQTELLKETKLADHGLYYGNLAVDRPTQYPAVLVECAFMILPEQEAMIKTDKFRGKIAEAVTKGIEKFLKGYEHER